ncbi:MAG: hypothetical protein A2Z15_08325 [Chloroflexi bacterium RBG_16_50_11]|nr:MAG: hypothetical protein A2Z15_08325 [Chloroflexi bacterium RBG_16_50_11]
MEAILIAPCGMNCALCSAYLAREYDLKKQGIMRSYCMGCRPRGKNCAFMKKSCERLGKGLVKYCYECADYPCRRLKHLDKRYRTNYHMSVIENLEFIRNQGIEKFLKRETEKWKCPECGGTISCHGGLCFKCGVERLKAKKKGRYMWEDD